MRSKGPLGISLIPVASTTIAPGRPCAKRLYQSMTSCDTSPLSLARQGTIAGTQVRCCKHRLGARRGEYKWLCAASYSDLNRDELSDKCTQYFTTIRNPHQRLLSGILEYQRRLYLKQINPSDDIQLSTKRPLFPWQDFDSEAVSDVNTLLYYLLNTGLAPFDEHLEPQVNFFDVKKINKKPVLACRFENQHTLVPAMWSNKHIIHRALEKHLIPWVEINIKQFDSFNSVIIDTISSKDNILFSPFAVSVIIPFDFNCCISLCWF